KPTGTPSVVETAGLATTISTRFGFEWTALILSGMRYLLIRGRSGVRWGRPLTAHEPEGDAAAHVPERERDPAELAPDSSILRRSGTPNDCPSGKPSRASRDRERDGCSERRDRPVAAARHTLLPLRALGTVEHAATAFADRPLPRRRPRRLLAAGRRGAGSD